MRGLVKVVLSSSLGLSAAAAIADRGNLVFEIGEPAGAIIESSPEKQYLTVYALDDIPIFINPTYTSATVTTIPIGQPIEIYNEIKSDNNQAYFVSDDGYIRHEDVTYLEEYVFYPVNQILYAVDGAHVLDLPDKDTITIKTLSLNDSVHVTGYNNQGFYRLASPDWGFIHESELMTTKYIIRPTYNVSGGLTPSGGVYYYGGRKETYYSSRVLYHYRTPQWYLDNEGFYHDSNGYYVVAASDMAQGTVFSCSKGSCIVLDSGCAAGVTDYYVNW